MNTAKIIFIVLLLTACQTYRTDRQESVQQAGPLPPPNQVETLSSKAKPFLSENTVDAAIEGFSFKPSTIRIKQGSTVTWTQKDSAPHTVTVVSGPELFDSGVLKTDQTFSQTFTTPGTYEYKCTIHPSMRGVVVVE